MPLQDCSPLALVQFFITRIVGSGNFPDIDIITLPSYDSEKPLGFDELLRVVSDGGGTQSASSPSVLVPLDPQFASILFALASSITDGLPNIGDDGQGRRLYIEHIYTNYQVPILNSPLSGKTLREIADAAMVSAAYQALVQGDIKKFTIYIFAIAGTTIIIGQSDVISLALNGYLKNLIIALRGRPKDSTNQIRPPKRKQKRRTEKRTPKRPK